MITNISNSNIKDNSTVQEVVTHTMYIMYAISFVLLQRSKVTGICLMVDTLQFQNSDDHREISTPLVRIYTS